MPILNKVEFEKSLSVLSGVGDTLQDVDKHYSKLILFAKNNRATELIQEVVNLRQNWNFIINSFSVKTHAFSWLINVPTGQKREVVYQDLIKGGITDQMCSDVIEEVKKKFAMN